jgi:hypothetical protein
MLKKKDLIAGAVLSIKLKEDLYTLGQLHYNHRLECFDITRKTDEWSGVDLNTVNPLFCLVVAESRLLKLFHSNQSGIVIANQRETPRRAISYGGRPTPELVEMDERYDSTRSTVITRNLNITEHLDIIYSHELTGMVGQPEKIRSRLLRYFETGVNWDESKVFLFPNIQPPLPKHNKT